MITFHCPGKPIAQGSKRWLPNRRMVEANAADLRPWRAAITAIATHEMRKSDMDFPRHGPVRLTVTFYYTRPKSHYGTGKNTGIVKPNAPAFNIGPYDLDKTIRGVGDALQDAGVFVNDAQIVQIVAQKRYADQAGTHVVVEEVNPLDGTLFG